MSVKSPLMGFLLCYVILTTCSLFRFFTRFILTFILFCIAHKLTQTTTTCLRIIPILIHIHARHVLWSVTPPSFSTNNPWYVVPWYLFISFEFRYLSNIDFRYFLMILSPWLQPVSFRCRFFLSLSWFFLLLDYYYSYYILLFKRILSLKYTKCAWSWWRFFSHELSCTPYTHVTQKSTILSQPHLHTFVTYFFFLSISILFAHFTRERLNTLF